jgi:hypothetical protein
MMARPTPDFPKVKKAFMDAFMKTEPDWLIKENIGQQVPGMSIFTDEIMTSTCLDWLDVHGYSIRNIKPADDGKIMYFFEENEN